MLQLWGSADFVFNIGYVCYRCGDCQIFFNIGYVCYSCGDRQILCLILAMCVCVLVIGRFFFV